MGLEVSAVETEKVIDLNKLNGGQAFAKDDLKQTSDTLRNVEKILAQRNLLGLKKGKDGKIFPEHGNQFKNIIVLNDCNDSNAFGRILPVIRSKFGTATIDRIDIKPYAKLEIGFNLADYLVEIARRPETIFQPPTIILGNSAPRAEKNSNAKGCPFVFAELPFGQFYFGTFGEELSYIKSAIIGDVWQLDMPENTVFRSRYLSDAARDWIDGVRTVLTKKIKLSEIPDVNPLAIGTIDSLGNIKTGLTDNHTIIQELSHGDSILITIKGQQLAGRFAKSLADGDSGDIVLAKGSSCQNLSNLNDTSFDIYCLNGNAVEKFELGKAKVRPGDVVSIQLQR